MRKVILSVAMATALAACSSAQLSQAESDANAALNAVTAACQGAQTAEATAKVQTNGGAANTVASISSYVDAACGTSAAIIAVAQNPSTTTWLNGLNADLVAATATAPAATAPASVPAS
jgi:hypothetical protein